MADILLSDEAALIISQALEKEYPELSGCDNASILELVESLKMFALRKSGGVLIGVS